PRPGHLVRTPRPGHLASRPRPEGTRVRTGSGPSARTTLASVRGPAGCRSGGVLRRGAPAGCHTSLTGYLAHGARLGDEARAAMPERGARHLAQGRHARWAVAGRVRVRLGSAPGKIGARTTSTSRELG